jgi:hypothetical protein
MFQRILKIAIENPPIFLASFLPIVVLFLALYRIKYLTRSTKYISLFLILFIVTDLPLWITSGLQLNNLAYYFSRDTFISIFLASTFFIGNKIDKIPLLIIIGIMVTILFLQWFGGVGYGEYLWINRILLAGIVIFYFFRLLQTPKVKDIIVFPFFWISSGILFYNLGTFIIYFFFRYSIKSNTEREKYFANLSDLALIVLFLLFGVAFFVLKKNDKFRK